MAFSLFHVSKMATLVRIRIPAIDINDVLHNGFRSMIFHANEVFGVKRKLELVVEHEAGRAECWFWA